MTKLKSKKMTKSTFAVIVLSILMVAMLAFGGTYAYFTAVTGNVSEKVQTGIIKLNANTVTVGTKDAVSGDTVFSAVKVNRDTTSNRGHWIFVTFKVGVYSNAECTTPVGSPAVGDNAEAQATAYANAAADSDTYLLQYTMGDGWTAVRDNDKDDTTTVFAYHVQDKVTDGVHSIDATQYPAAIDVCSAIKFLAKTQSTTAKKGDLMGVYVQVSINADAIQDMTEAGAAVTEAQAAYDMAHPAANS